MRTLTTGEVADEFDKVAEFILDAEKKLLTIEAIGDTPIWRVRQQIKANIEAAQTLKTVCSSVRAAANNLRYEAKNERDSLNREF